MKFALKMQSPEVRKNIRKYIIPTFKGTGYKLYRGKNIISLNDSILLGMITRVSSWGALNFQAIVMPLSIKADYKDGAIVMSYAQELRYLIGGLEWLNVDEYDTEEFFTYIADNFHEQFLPWLEARNTPEKIIADLSKGGDVTKLVSYKQFALIHSIAQIGDLKTLEEVGSEILKANYSKLHFDYHYTQKERIEVLVELAAKGDKEGVRKIQEENILKNIEQMKLEKFLT